MNASAEMHLFQNPEKTKSFSAELTGYDAEKKLVSVRLKNGRFQSFTIDRLCKEDQRFVNENAKRLAVGNKLDVLLDSYQEPSAKETAERIVNRVYPSGYGIVLNNRSKEAFTDLTLNYTVYYEVQGYVESDREPKESKGSLVCEVVAGKGRMDFKTEAVKIVSGKLDAKIENQRRRTPEGEVYFEPVVVEPGGRRKDLLVGCLVEVVVDGQVVKTVTEGSIPEVKE